MFMVLITWPCIMFFSEEFSPLFLFFPTNKIHQHQNDDNKPQEMCDVKPFTHFVSFTVTITSQTFPWTIPSSTVWRLGINRQSKSTSLGREPLLSEAGVNRRHLTLQKVLWKLLCSISDVCMSVAPKCLTLEVIYILTWGETANHLWSCIFLSVNMTHVPFFFCYLVEQAADHISLQ